MYVWTARIQAGIGRTNEATNQLAKNRDLISSITDHEFVAWATAGGDPLGSLYLSSRVTSVEQYMTLNAMVSQSADYHAASAEGAEFFEGSVETTLYSIVAAAGDFTGEPALSLITTSTAKAGRQADAVAWGAEVVKLLNEISERPCAFTSAVLGGTGDVAVILNYDSPADVDVSTERILTNADYQRLVAATGELLVDGSGHRVLLARLP